MDITYFLQDNVKIPEKSKQKNDPQTKEFLAQLNELSSKGSIDLLELSFMMQLAKCSSSIVNVLWMTEIVNRLSDKGFAETCQRTFKIFDINQNCLCVDIDKIIGNLISSKKGSIEFTNDQRNAINEIFSFLVDYKRKTFGLYGYAGTGKTTTIVELVSFLVSNRHVNNIAFTAPTNKAVNVMKSKMRSNIKSLAEMYTGKEYDKNDFNFEDIVDILHGFGVKIDFITIHRLLNYKNDFDIEGDRIFVRNGPSSISNYELIIVDECSMIPIQIITHLFEDILTDNHKRSPKLIFCGDPAQLSPVNDDISAIFLKRPEQLSYDYFSRTMLNSEKNIRNKSVTRLQSIGSLERYNRLTNSIIGMKYVVLKDVVRNKIENVVGLCNNVRKWVENIIKAPDISKYSGAGVYIYKCDGKKKTESKWFNKFISMQKNNTNDNISNIILTWTNRQTDEYNTAIRNIMFKDKKNIDKFEVGDMLMLNDFYNFEEANVKGRFYTSEQIKVVDKDVNTKTCSEFTEQISKIMVKMKSSDYIIGKYKNLIKMLNTKTIRRYTVWKLSVQRMSEAKVKDTIPELYTIRVIHDQSKDLLKHDKETCLNMIKDFRKTLNEQFKEQESKIDKEIIRPLWRQWNKIFVDPFANVNYGNSHSVHKAQGSSFYNVFVDSDDILNNNNGDEAKRCIYTALTRSSNEIHLLV
jgi:hypothetical protein